MSKRTRTILFFSFVFLFIATIPVLTVYTQGYRLDWENRKLVETGGMDFGVRPLGVRVFIDGQFHQETNFLFRDIIIRNILPREYDVRIERESYTAWHKIVTVGESIVTKFPDVRLFPQDPTRTDVATGITSTYFSPDGRNALVLVEAEGALDQLRLLSFSAEQLETPVLTLRANERVERAGWNAESTVAWFVTVLGPQTTLRTISVQDAANPVVWDALTNSYRRGALQTALILPTTSATSIFVAPYDTGTKTYDIDSLIIGQQNPISVVDGVRAGSSVGSSLIYMDADNILIERDMPSSQLTILATNLFNSELAAPLSLVVENNLRAVGIISGSELFVWQRGYQLTKISDNVAGVAFSPDATKLAFWNSTDTSVLWLETVFGPPAREREQIEIINSHRDVKNVFWLETLGAHVVITTTKDVLITELDERGGRNTVSYTNENAASFFAPLLQRVYSVTAQGNLTTFSVE